MGNHSTSISCCTLCLVAAALVHSSVPAVAEGGADEVLPEIAAPPGSGGSAVDETPDLWFVELSSPPAADGTPLARLRNEKAAFRAAARDAGLKYTERFAFDTLWNGLSVNINPTQVAALARLPGVNNIYPVLRLAPDPVLSPDFPDLVSALHVLPKGLQRTAGWSRGSDSLQ